ncbi:MAG TPA: ABC transporter substrate-binding protein [Pseudonocardia sp.]
MPDRSTISRRRLLGMLAAGSAVAACGDAAVPGLNAPPAAVHVRIGVVWPQAGPNAPFGTDLKRGWDLWLQQNGGKLGQYVADVVTADEGTSPQSATAAVQRLLQNDKVDIVVGLIDSAATLAVIPLMNAAKKVLLVAGASAIDITRGAGSVYVWRTSYSDPQMAAPMGAQLAQAAVRDAVFVVAPADDEGTATIAAFQTAFQSGGGVVVGTGRPVAGNTDYGRIFTQIQRARAKATFCALSPADGAEFVAQYAQAGLSGPVPLYGSGPITEAALDKDGQAALGVQTTLHYSDQVAIAANTKFVAAYRTAYNAGPTCFSVQGYDAGNVLDAALAQDGMQFNGDSVTDQLGQGARYDSPRGKWKFDEQGPLQDVYLRKVQNVGGALVNAVLFDLGPAGQPAA